MRAVAVVLLLICGGCVPFVQHGPWVRSGTSGGFAVSGSAMRGLDGERTGVNVGVDLAVRAGYVPQDSTRPAFAAGVTLPWWAVLFAGEMDSPTDALQFVSADAYMTGPRSARFTSSLGGTVSTHHFMPYVQFGSRNPKWYTTQAFLILPESDLYMWLPSITSVGQEAGRARATNVNFGAGIGRNAQQTAWMLSIGVTMEFFRKNARVR